MNAFIKTLAAGLVGIVALGATAASADDRPAYCPERHDHRAHNADYYDYYPQRDYDRRDYDRRDRSRVGVTIRVGDPYYGRNGYDRDYDRRWRDDRRIVKREVIPARRYRARFVVIEEVVDRGRRRHPRLVCTVSVRGPEARRIPYERIERVADRNCSRRARIRIDA